ncbi:hypothetical protein HII31_08175 [Pseudocercospora fuligena]|uniref:F-box domain-containing protein n=1 Tax=Pseudocercospora fuligena TaxID=685502 RepID=A0A8H6RI53_9PEZI|nr:hypothetical protein HII31_08175 [Pseudocercospora fuligena]
MGRNKIDIWATPANLQTKCRLLSLTPELRNMIWEFALSVEPDSSLTVSFTKSRGPQTEHSVLRLLETCRFIYCEALGIFYTTNNLKIVATSFYNGDLLDNLRGLTRLPPRRLTGISQLTLILIYSDTEILTRILKLLPSLVNLKRLRLMLNINEHEGTIYGIKSDLDTMRKHMTREMPLLEKAAKMCTSIEHVGTWYTKNLDPDSEHGKLILTSLDLFIKAMPYWKAKKAAYKAAKAAASTQASIATAQDAEAQAT